MDSRQTDVSPGLVEGDAKGELLCIGLSDAIGPVDTEDQVSAEAVRIGESLSILAARVVIDGKLGLSSGSGLDSKGEFLSL